MLRHLRVVGLLGCLAVAAALLFGGSVRAEEKKTVTGTVEVEKDDEGAITAVKVVNDDTGAEQKMVLDAKAKELGEKLGGKKAEVSGTVTDGGDMKVTSYKEVKDDEGGGEDA